MELRCGYNCINLSINRTFRNMRLQTVLDKDIDKIVSVIDNNISLLGDIIKYNIDNNIYIFRITSELVPFFNHIEMINLLIDYKILERDCVIEEFNRIKKMVQSVNGRITVHPGQYNVLNSYNDTTVRNTILELNLQSSILDKLGGDTIVLHLGGGYGDKDRSKRRFVRIAKSFLGTNILQKLALENDDKTYTSEDVIEVSQLIGCKWVHDFHHERLNPSKDTDYLLRNYPPTKFHICEGVDNKLVISHANHVSKETIASNIATLKRCGYENKTVDFMFEAKLKNLALTNVMRPVGNGLWKLK